MSIALQAYTAHERIAGGVVGDIRLVDLLATATSVVIQNCLVAPLTGAPRGMEPLARVEVDDLLVVVAPAESVVPGHAAWHALTIELGPYRVSGELPSMPGFDPARALARPSGSFVLLGNVTVESLADREFEPTDHAFALVNRYAVDSVESDLELGFFFPGALVRAGRPVFRDEPDLGAEPDPTDQVDPADETVVADEGALREESAYNAQPV